MLLCIFAVLVALWDTLFSLFFFFSSRRRHTRSLCDWSSDVCSSDLQDFGDVALWEVVRIGSWKNIPGDTVIIREGDQGESFYLLVEGEVGVTLLSKPLNIIKPGGCFGEILYFTGATGRRTTTIVSTQQITVIDIKTDALRAATDACQVGFNKAFMRVLVDRLSQANLKLARR